MRMEDAARLYVIPTLNWLGFPYASARACCMLLAIGKQESGWRHRRQVPAGPGRSAYQIETQTALAVLAKWEHGRAKWCELFPDDRIDEENVRASVERSEIGATLIARGILRLHPSPLPPVDPASETQAWIMYAGKGMPERTWRPGKPHPEFWPANWREAVEVTLRCWP